MRILRQTYLRIDPISRRGYGFRSSKEGMNFLPLVFGSGCCLWTLPGTMSGLLAVGAAAWVAVAVPLLEPMFDERRRASIRWRLFDAPSLAFETFVTLVALSMRLSPIERDFVATSLFTLLCRYWNAR